MTNKRTKKKEEKKTQDDQQPAENLEQVDNSIENQETDDDSSCENDIEKLEAQVAELKDKHLRLFSEFDNYRKRTAKERIELFKTAHADLILDLLPVVDDFDRAVKSFEDNNDADTIKHGVELIQNKLYSTLERKGLKCMESKEKDFDTDYHEAITEIPAPSKKLKSKVVDVVEKGYLLNEKVIRYAKVVVGK